MNPVNFELIDEVLIEEVRKHENLYNAKLKSYRDRNEAEKSWIIISQTTNIPVAECKQSWKRLRDKYVREKKKHQSSFKSGAAATHTAKWTLSETMSFLDDHLKPRSTASNIVVVDVENDEPSCSTSAELNESLSSTSEHSESVSKKKRKFEDQLEDLIEVARAPIGECFRNQNYCKQLKFNLL
ncbi:uncharacterized protein LOC113475669 isoform X2 [Ciona intestinalis]